MAYDRDLVVGLERISLTENSLRYVVSSVEPVCLSVRAIYCMLKKHTLWVI